MIITKECLGDSQTWNWCQKLGWFWGLHKYTHQNSTFVRKEGKKEVRKDGRDGGEEEGKKQEKKENVNHRLICIDTCVVHT